MNPLNGHCLSQTMKLGRTRVCDHWFLSVYKMSQNVTDIAYLTKVMWKSRPWANKEGFNFFFRAFFDLQKCSALAECTIQMLLCTCNNHVAAICLQKWGVPALPLQYLLQGPIS